jgi:RHS repeat-associated protein
MRRLSQRDGYDAWGKRRFPNGTDDPTGSIVSQTIRGFTGQEMLASVGLVHLNGRVYDPYVGRMTSADPMVPDPLNGQTWNRYSYVINNPLAFTDPTGYCFLGLCGLIDDVGRFFSSIGRLISQNIGSIIQIAVTAACVAAGEVCAPLVALVAAGTAFAIAGITTGNLGYALRAGLIAGVTALAFNAVGDITLGPGHPAPEFGSSAFFENVAGHALVGCASAVASGGSCRAGALSAAVPAFAGPIVNDQNFSIRSLVTNSVLGGLASVAGGGKFGNGAVTGAFGYLFNASNNQSQFHDQLRDEIADVYALQGWNVATEVTLNMLYDGVWYEMRADIVFTKPDTPGYWVVDVKTGSDPGLTQSQSYILPGIANGLPVYISSGYEGNNRITPLGFQDGQLLPPQQGTVTIYYQQNATSQPTQTYLTPVAPGQVPYPMPFRWRAPGGVQ